ncbi:MAG: type IV pilus assembly protein PilM [Planctomycetes bacterium]|nr:type IV pilus assembly protein PilM [Planctomycetota bacterium]
MASSQAVWGLDLGRSALKAVKLRPGSDGNVELIAQDLIEHAQVLTQPDADRNQLISAALEKFLSRNDISKDFVIVSVPGQQTLARFTKLPPVEAKRIPDIVRYEADQQIPFDMDEVIWDYQTFQREGAPDLEVGIFAMKRELIREHLLHFEQASIEPMAVQSSPLSVYNAAHFDGMLGNETTILLDIGAENTDLIIATKDTFWTRTVPIGGNHFTEALVKAFKLTFSKAENLKRSAATSKYARQIFQAMRPVFADLVQELQRSVGSYSSTHRDTKVEKVICFGAASRLPGLRKYLHQNMGIPVTIADTFSKAVPGGGVDQAELKERTPTFGVAYGLAVQGLDLAKVSCNLLPVEIAKQLVWRRKRPAFAATAACIFLAGSLIWFRQTSDMRALAAGAAASAPNPANAEDAWDLIESGPSMALPERVQAQAIRNAGKKLKRELQDFSGQGDTERAQTESIIRMHDSKATVPRILQAIHESVPVLRGALGKATTQEEVLKALASGASPRTRRKQIWIDRIDMQFQPNVNEIVWESVCPGTAEEPINDPDSDLPAFKIEISGRTPYADSGKLLCEEFLTALRKNGRKPEAGFYFDRVYLFDRVKVPLPASTSSKASTGRSSHSFGQRGAFGAKTAAARTPSVDPALLDPVTHERIEDDWEFVVWIDAIPEDYVAPEGEGGDGD